MHDLALQIEQATVGLKVAALVCAFGVRTVLDAATTDVRRAREGNCLVSCLAAHTARTQRREGIT